VTLPGQEKIIEVVEATWPPATTTQLGPWTIRGGAGGGKRVSAATANGPVTAADIPLAEAAMAELGQAPLFMLRPGEGALDTLLDARGYTVIDPVTAYACPTSVLLKEPLPHMTGFQIWPPVAIQEEIWQGGGIGPARLAVMHRAPLPKTSILGRVNARAAGTAFVAIHDGIAMLHALEVAPAQRRQGAGRHILRHAAKWAQDQGASTFTLVTTSENLPSNSLYTSQKMLIVGKYHYRVGIHSQGI